MSKLSDNPTSKIEKQDKVINNIYYSFFSTSLGVIPPYRDAHKFVMQQRCEHFNDLQHALKVMRKISDEDDIPYQMSMMYLLDEGALRFVKIPKVKENLYNFYGIFLCFISSCK